MWSLLNNHDCAVGFIVLFFISLRLLLPTILSLHVASLYHFQGTYSYSLFEPIQQVHYRWWVINCTTSACYAYVVLLGDKPCNKLTK